MTSVNLTGAPDERKGLVSSVQPPFLSSPPLPLESVRVIVVPYRVLNQQNMTGTTVFVSQQIWCLFKSENKLKPRQQNSILVP